MVKSFRATTRWKKECMKWTKHFELVQSKIAFKRKQNMIQIVDKHTKKLNADNPFSSRFFFSHCCRRETKWNTHKQQHKINFAVFIYLYCWKRLEMNDYDIFSPSLLIRDFIIAKWNVDDDDDDEEVEDFNYKILIRLIFVCEIFDFWAGSRKKMNPYYM